MNKIKAGWRAFAARPDYYVARFRKGIVGLIGVLSMLVTFDAAPASVRLPVSAALGVLTIVLNVWIPNAEQVIDALDGDGDGALGTVQEPVSGEIVEPDTDEIPVPVTDVIPVVEGDDARTEGPTVQDILSRVAAEYPADGPVASHYSPETAEIPAQQATEPDA